VARHAAIFGVGEDAASDILGPATLLEDLVADKGMLLGRGILFVVEVVQQAGDAVFFDILAKFFGVSAHAGFDCKCMFPQAFRLGVFT
jgi:hypothetical protein